MRIIGVCTDRSTTLDETAGAEYANGMEEYATGAEAMGVAIEYAAGLDSNTPLGLAAAIAKSVVRTIYKDRHNT